MKHTVVCLSTTNFHPLPTRKQNVMTRLKNAEVLYFDPPVSFLAPLKDSKARERLFRHQKPGERVGSALTIYALPPVLPFANKWRPINRINQFFLGRFVRKKMKAHGFDAPVLWCYSPSSCDILRHVPHKTLVYDCVDRHSAYPGMIVPALVDRMEAELAAAADQVFATAAGLAERLRAFSDRVSLIPNGAAFELFSTVQDPALPIPEAMRDLKQPVFGFAGMFQECIDFGLLERLADACPNATVFLIGRPLPGVDVSTLASRKNVVIHDLVPQTELPMFLKGFTVCLNVFRAGELSKDVSPLKFYEYLATGKPIVSTREPLQVSDFEEVVYIADEAEQFILLCLEAAAERDEEKTKKRMAFAKASSWDERVREMEEILRKRDIF